MATIGIKAMEIMAIMVTVIKDMVAMITLVTTTIMDMGTTTVSKPVGEASLMSFGFLSAIPFISCHFFKMTKLSKIRLCSTFVDQSGGYGKSPRRGGHTNSYKPY